MPAPKGNKYALGANSGRPTKYDPEKHPAMVEKLCLLGATDREIADILEVNCSTIYEWKSKHKEFSNALRIGKDACDSRVERRLYERALGYTGIENKVFNNNGEPMIVETEKHYPPDTTAAIFWLKNRKRDQWSEKVDHNIDITPIDQVKITFVNPTDTVIDGEGLIIE